MSDRAKILAEINEIQHRIINTSGSTEPAVGLIDEIIRRISALPAEPEPEYWYRVNTGDGPILCESLEECQSLLDKLNSGGSPELVEIREVQK